MIPGVYLVTAPDFLLLLLLIFLLLVFAARG